MNWSSAMDMGLSIVMNNRMRRDSKIYVAGHRGLVGSALLRRLKDAGYSNIVTRSHAELDLVDQGAVKRFFETERPEFVLLAAARVGGIYANDTYPADFVRDNLSIQTNVIHESWRNGVSKLLFLGSSCIYPRDCPQPIKEQYLLTGLLEPTNEAYAIAKIAGIKMCAAYNRQHGTNFISVMPTNLYGPGDNYNLETSHVVPALIRKAHEAKLRGDKSFLVWGTGEPLREFLYSDDLADACIFLLEEKNAEDIGEIINIGTGQEVTVKQLAALVSEVVGFDGGQSFDSAKPDGTPRKLLDSSRLTALGWQARTSLTEGLSMAYRDFLSSTWA